METVGAIAVVCPPRESGGVEPDPVHQKVEPLQQVGDGAEQGNGEHGAEKLSHGAQAEGSALLGGSRRVRTA